MVLPYFSNFLVEQGANNTLVFTINKYTVDAAMVAFLSSINLLFTFALAPYIAWKSDRIWTRFGRRKPFVILGWVGVGLSICFVPLANELRFLVLCIFLYNMFSDMAVAATYEPLFMEVVPPQQRGRAAAMRQAVVLISGIFLNWVLVRNWDRVFYAGDGFALTGEHAAYWAISALIIGAACLVGLGVKEVKPRDWQPTTERFSVRSFFSSVFMNKQQMKIYMLVFAAMSMQQGLGAVGVMMLTHQFGYTKEALGEFYTMMKVIQFFCILPLAGLIADRFDRLKIFAVGISISTMHPVLYWAYIHFFAPKGIPPLPMIMAFDVFNMLVDFAVMIAIAPLAFDYIPRKKMGTVYAGMSLVRGALKMLMLNAIGWFAKGYSALFVKDGPQDYSSGLIFLFFIGILGTACTFYFLREREAGRIIPYGKLEHEAMTAAQSNNDPATPAAVGRS